jgi:hypothetical protein
MKLKTTLTILSAVIGLGVLAANASSQNRFNGPRNMGITLNTASNEINPMIAPRGLSLYFTSDRPGGLGGTDIYVSQRATLNSPWETPQNLGPTVNSASNDNVNAFSLDGRTMFLQSPRAGSGGIGGSDIYMSTRTNANNDLGWTTPVNLGATVNSTFSDIGATYFEDPATGAGFLIFSSDRIAMNQLDYRFYQSTRNPDGSFNGPTLIDELNGEGGHFAATVRPDGLEIYFGSARPGGLNVPKVDIWASTRVSTSAAWGTPSLVAGINGTDEDRFPKLSPDGAILFMSSNRPGGFGGFDLYSTSRCSLYSASPCGVNRTVSDFNGDGISDISVFRPSEGNWYIMESGTNTFRAEHFGLNGDKMVPGDYDGDALIDLAVFRPSTGIWWIQPSSNPSNVLTTQWGLATDKPVPGDYDGDGQTDIAVYRDGTWYIRHSSTGQIAYSQWGLASDIPIAGSNTQ